MDGVDEAMGFGGGKATKVDRSIFIEDGMGYDEGDAVEDGGAGAINDGGTRPPRAVRARPPRTAGLRWPLF